MSPQTNDVAVIIPTYNRVGRLLECLQSIYEQTDVVLQPFVVNDGSKDGTTTAVNQKFPKAIVIEGSGDLWWAGAINLGVKTAMEAGYNYFLLINDDNKLAPNAAAALLDYAEAHPGVIVGSLVLIENTNIIHDAGAIVKDWWNGKFRQYHHQEFHHQFTDVLPTDYLGGQGVLIPRSVFEKNGLIDTAHFPHYHSDTDFYLRARAKNIAIVVNPAAIVYNAAHPLKVASRNFGAAVKGLFQGYISRRSPNNIRDVTRLYMRHCQPRILIPFVLTRRMLGYAFIYSRNYWRLRQGKTTSISQ